MRVSSHKLEIRSLANSEQALNFLASRPSSILYYYNCLPKQKPDSRPTLKLIQFLSAKRIDRKRRIDRKKYYAFLKYKMSQNKDSIEDKESRTATW